MLNDGRSCFGVSGALVESTVQKLNISAQQEKNSRYRTKETVCKTSSQRNQIHENRNLYPSRTASQLLPSGSGYKSKRCSAPLTIAQPARTPLLTSAS
jgi:hypothetical protein